MGNQTGKLSPDELLRMQQESQCTVNVLFLLSDVFMESKYINMLSSTIGF